MEDQVFRKKSLERISSPEELSDYLHVTSPSVWLILTAIILLLCGMLLWSSVASIDSLVTGTAQVDEGSMRILFDDENLARNVKVGMTAVVGETETKIETIGTGPSGATFAMAPTTLADGSYPVKVILKRTQVLKLLFN